MASTYTTNSGIEKIATGEQSGTWGNTTNLNFDIIDRAMSGVGTIDLGGGTTYTLQTTDGALSEGGYRVLVLTNAGGACTITIDPNDAQKFYFVNNTSGFEVTFAQGGGSGATHAIGNGKTAGIYADGSGTNANVVAISEDLTGLLLDSNNLSDLDNFTTARQNLGVEIGVDVQAYDAGLNSIAGLTTQANRMIYTTASDTYSVATLTAAGRALLDDADAAAQRTTLGVAIGTDVQAYDAGLNSIAGLSTQADRMIYTTASDTYSVATLTAAGRALLDDADAAAQRTTLGLGTLATASTINNGDWSGTDLSVANGGTGISTVPANGQLLIGNGTKYAASTLTEGDNVTITNASGSITIAVERGTTVGDDFSNSVRDAYLNLTGGNTTSQVATTNYKIGTYILAWDVLSGSDVFPGEVATGGGLNAFGVTNGGLTYIDGQRRRADGWAQWNYDYTHTGTWRCMGYAEDYYNTGGGGSGVGTLWIRIL